MLFFVFVITSCPVGIMKIERRALTRHSLLLTPHAPLILPSNLSFTASHSLSRIL